MGNSARATFTIHSMKPDHAETERSSARSGATWQLRWPEYRCEAARDKDLRSTRMPIPGTKLASSLYMWAARIGRGCTSQDREALLFNSSLQPAWGRSLLNQLRLLVTRVPRFSRRDPPQTTCQLWSSCPDVGAADLAIHVRH